jgi:hypothetical protein
MCSRQQACTQRRLDRKALAIEPQALIDLDFGVEIIGFSLAELALVLAEERESRRARLTSPRTRSLSCVHQPQP